MNEEMEVVQLELQIFPIQTSTLQRANMTSQSHIIIDDVITF